MAGSKKPFLQPALTVPIRVHWPGGAKAGKWDHRLHFGERMWCAECRGIYFKERREELKLLLETLQESAKSEEESRHAKGSDLANSPTRQALAHLQERLPGIRKELDDEEGEREEMDRVFCESGQREKTEDDAKDDAKDDNLQGPAPITVTVKLAAFVDPDIAEVCKKRQLEEEFKRKRAEVRALSQVVQEKRKAVEAQRLEVVHNANNRYARRVTNAVGGFGITGGGCWTLEGAAGGYHDVRLPPRQVALGFSLPHCEIVEEGDFGGESACCKSEPGAGSGAGAGAGAGQDPEPRKAKTDGDRPFGNRRFFSAWGERTAVDGLVVKGLIPATDHQAAQKGSGSVGHTEAEIEALLDAFPLEQPPESILPPLLRHALQSLRDAEKRFYLASRHYWEMAKQLGIRLPGGEEEPEPYVVMKNAAIHEKIRWGVEVQQYKKFYRRVCRFEALVASRRVDGAGDASGSGAESGDIPGSVPQQDLRDLWSDPQVGRGEPMGVQLPGGQKYTFEQLSRGRAGNYHADGSPCVQTLANLKGKILVGLRVAQGAVLRCEAEVRRLFAMAGERAPGESK